MLAERGLSLAYTTILRWVQRYKPEFVKRWNRFGTSTVQSWRVNEMYLRTAAVPRAKCDVAEAKTFFWKAIKPQGQPPKTIAPRAR